MDVSSWSSPMISFEIVMIIIELGVSELCLSCTSMNYAGPHASFPDMHRQWDLKTRKLKTAL